MNQQHQFPKPISLLLKIPVPWVFILTYFFGLIPQMLLSATVHSPKVSMDIKIAGAVLLVLGLMLAGWCLLIFRKVRNTTTPGESSKKLIIKGPYHLSRNPMYVSLTLMYLGEAGLLVQLWPVLVLPLMFLYLNKVVIPLEEQTLRTDFEEDYINYCGKVRRWF